MVRFALPCWNVVERVAAHQRERRRHGRGGHVTAHPWAGVVGDDAHDEEAPGLDTRLGRAEAVQGDRGSERHTDVSHVSVRGGDEPDGRQERSEEADQVLVRSRADGLEERVVTQQRLAMEEFLLERARTHVPTISATIAAAVDIP